MDANSAYLRKILKQCHKKEINRKSMRLYRAFPKPDIGFNRVKCGIVAIFTSFDFIHSPMHRNICGCNILSS